jgi:hypothetical protein
MAQLTRPALYAEIDGRFPDNTTQLITPAVVRAFLRSLVESALLPATDPVGVDAYTKPESDQQLLDEAQARLDDDLRLNQQLLDEAQARLDEDLRLAARLDALSAPVAVGSGRTVTFDKERHWPAITTGTYVLDAAGAEVDVCFQLVLAAGCTEISIPTTGFVKLSNATFDATRTNYYSFLVGVDGLIQYYLRQVAV